MMKIEKIQYIVDGLFLIEIEIEEDNNQIDSIFLFGFEY